MKVLIHIIYDSNLSEKLIINLFACCELAASLKKKLAHHNEVRNHAENSVDTVKHLIEIAKV